MAAERDHGIDSVLIVGASVAGVGTADELRRCGFAGRITLVDAQTHLPYDRPPLSKALLGGVSEPSGIAFHEPAYYARMGIQLVLGSAARSLDPARRSVRLESGRELTSDCIVLASGARARPFPVASAAGRVHLLRDIDDARRLRGLLGPGKRLVIIGGGFIGAEVASTASGFGVNVVLVEAARRPFARLLGDDIAARLANLHQAAGVDLVCGEAVEQIDARNGGSRVILADGRQFEADIVLAGLGAVPNLEWLAASGVQLANGVACDDRGRTSVSGIFAAGDVAAWINPATGLHERHEHWTAAKEQGRIVAQTIAGEPSSSWQAFVPYVWSDFHGVRLQMFGSTGGAEDVQVVHDDPARRAFVAEYHSRGRLIGVVGCNAAARTMRYAAQLMTAQEGSVT